MNKYAAEMYLALYDPKEWSYQQMLYDVQLPFVTLGFNGLNVTSTITGFESLHSYNEANFEIMNNPLPVIDTQMVDAYEQTFLNYISMLNNVLNPLLKFQSNQID